MFSLNIVDQKVFKFQVYNEAYKNLTHAPMSTVEYTQVRQSIKRGNPAHVPMSLPLSPDSDVVASSTQSPFGFTVNPGSQNSHLFASEQFAQNITVHMSTGENK